VRSKQRLAHVTAHELAHMWFGDLVTMTWWDDLWLNESFADWMGEKIAHKLYPQYKIDLESLGTVQRLLAGDARPSTSPVRRPVETIADMFAEVFLAYGKGKSTLRMVEEWIGPETFQQGVRSYLDEHAWGNTVAADLFEHLSEAAGQDVTGVLSSFLDQPGFPMITLTANGKGKVTISQKRFLNYGVEAESFEWDVPVRLKYFDGSKTEVKTMLLDKPSMTVDLGRDVVWVHPDAGAVGYYRWKVPSEMLYKIAEDPETTLDERERTVFLASIKALLDAGEIGGDDYLRALGGYANVHTPEVIEAVTDGLGSIQTALITDDLRDAYAVYVRRTLRPALDTFGMAKREGEAEVISLLRPRLLGWVGGRGRDEEVQAYCKDLAEQFRNDPTSVDPSIAGVAVNVAVRDGGRAEFDDCMQRFESASVPAVRRTYLSALGAFEDGELQDAALAYVISGKLRPNELFSIPQGVGRTASGRDRNWAWLQANYATITSRIPPEFQAYMPYMASSCEKERLEAARAFFAMPEHHVEGTQGNLNKVADSTNDCITLRERESQTVADYLNQLLAGQ
jgi:alanyl aminopeptidase